MSSFPYILNHLNAVRGFSVVSFDSFDVTLTKKGLKRMLGTVSLNKTAASHLNFFY